MGQKELRVTSGLRWPVLGTQEELLVENNEKERELLRERQKKDKISKETWTDSRARMRTSSIVREDADALLYI